MRGGPAPSRASAVAAGGRGSDARRGGGGAGALRRQHGRVAAGGAAGRAGVGGRAVAAAGPHQGPLLRQHGERGGAAGRALRGAPARARRHAAGHRAQMEQIKRANKLFTNDCIFLRKTLNIPVISEKPLLFNGLNSLESPENETVDSSPSCDEGLATVQEDSSSSPSPQEPDNQPTAPEELSAKDFLQRLDLQIKLSKQAARKLKDDTVREEENEEGPYATSSYHQ
ncbi:lysM and putative peptidoglycan-binding domain-containing protein 2 isoform X2 [Dromaius novaehollandiae]